MVKNIYKLTKIIGIKYLPIAKFGVWRLLGSILLCKKPVDMLFLGS